MRTVTRPSSLRRPASWLLLAGCLGACGGARVPRTTILNLPPPVPPPGPDEARLMAVELQPDAREPVETAPSSSLFAMARRALDEVQPEVIGCYQQLLVTHPTAEGSVEVQLDLAASGIVQRAHLDQQGRGGFEALVPCLEGVFRAVRVRDVSPRGQYVSRVYSFTNPTVDRTVAAPVVVVARAPARAQPRGRGAPPAPPSAAPTAPAPGPGSLRPDELSGALAASPSLPACATLALRRTRRPTSRLTLRMTVGGDGAVGDATVTSTPPTAAPVATCVTEAARALRLRPSGITVRATLTLDLRRTPATPRAAR